MIPTKKEYLKAKKIVDAYEANEQKGHLSRIEQLRTDLTEYFKKNTIAGHYITQFVLDVDVNYKREVDINPIKPIIYHKYDGENDADIECIGGPLGFSVVFSPDVYE